MSAREPHVCECPLCRQGADHAERVLHTQMNLLLSRLDEQQRRWYVALEAQRLGHGGHRRLSEITGMDEDTIARGRREMADSLTQRPTEGVRLPGGGRPCAEKKTPS